VRVEEGEGDEWKWEMRRERAESRGVQIKDWRSAYRHKPHCPKF
jgi:hypothetical protein